MPLHPVCHPVAARAARDSPPMGVRSWFVHAESGRTRVLTAAAFGAAAAFAVSWFVPWQLTILVAWDVTAALVIGAVWLSIGRFTAQETKQFAIREDDTRAGTHFLLLGAALFSLVGVVLAFLKANEGMHRQEVL